jgi:tRNA nucleotidyltransferase (CCA-adding enzyme)
VNRISNEDFLHQILEDQKLDPNQIENLKNQRDAIVGELIKEIGGNPIIYNGGSYAKGTMIRASYDLDIVLYWPINFQYSPKNLYIEVGGVLQSKG